MDFQNDLAEYTKDETKISQYTLNGLGLRLSNKLKGWFFGSKDKRDAIINEDDDFSSLIVPTAITRLSYGLGYNGDTTVFHSLTNSVEEITFGADIRLSPIIGTNLGITFVSLYDRVLDPQIRETIVGGPDPDYSGDTYYLTYLTNSGDPEIAAMYSNSSNASGLFSADEFVKSSEKVLGIKFFISYKTCRTKGEYGALLDDYNIKNLKSSPKASVLSSYFQFDNFNLLYFIEIMIWNMIIPIKDHFLIIKDIKHQF